MKCFQKSLVVLLLISSLVLTLSFAIQAGDVKMGTLFALTGGLASYGDPIQKATDLAAELINSQGGLLGGKLELVHLDSQTSPQAGVDAAQKLVSIHGVPAFVGALSSGVTIPVAKSVAVPNEVVQISPSSTSPLLTDLEDNDFIFRTVPSDSLQGLVVGDLVADLGYKRMAIIYVNNDYGKGLSEATAKQFTARGGTVTASVGFEPNKASYRGELQQAARDNPEVLFLIAYTDDGGITIIRQSLEGGYFDKFIFSDGLKAPEIAEGIEDYLEGMYGTAPTALPGGNGPTLFKEAYTERFGEIPPKPYMDTAYDAVFVLAMAVEKAGKAEGAAIRGAIRELLSLDGEPVTVNEWQKARELIAQGKKIRYEGASGPVDFNEDGDVKGAIGIWQVKGGDIVDVDTVIQ